MPIKAEWDNPQKTIIRQTFSGNWTWEELYIVSDTITEMLDAVTYPVDLLLDLRNAPSLPTNALAHIRLLDREHRNQGKIVAVGLNAIIQVIYEVIIKIRPNTTARITIVKTLDEAYALFNASDTPPA